MTNTHTPPHVQHRLALPPSRPWIPTAAAAARGRHANDRKNSLHRPPWLTAMTPLQCIDSNAQPPASARSHRAHRAGHGVGYRSGSARDKERVVADGSSASRSKSARHGHDALTREQASSSPPLVMHMRCRPSSAQSAGVDVIALSSDPEDDVPDATIRSVVAEASVGESRAFGKTSKADNGSSTTARGKGGVGDSDEDVDEDEDEEQHEAKARLFAQHIQMYAAQEEDLSFTTRPFSKPEQETCAKRRDRIGREEQQAPKGTEVGTSANEGGIHFEVLPDLPKRIQPVLRSIDRCPLCYSSEFLNLAKKKKERKPSKRRLSSCSTSSKHVSGPARMLHLQMCMVACNVSLDQALALLSREQDRADKLRRQAYAESLSTETIWTSMTGETPPSTQAQLSALDHPAQKDGRRKTHVAPACVINGKCNGKAKATSPTKQAQTRILGGSRGGVRRESGLVQAPVRVNGDVKRRCIALFGHPPMRFAGDVTASASPSSSLTEQRWREWYDFAQAEEAVTSPFANRRNHKRRQGLGMGSCCGSADARGASSTRARLTMGGQLGAQIASLFEHRDDKFVVRAAAEPQLSLAA